MDQDGMYNNNNLCIISADKIIEYGLDAYGRERKEKKDSSIRVFGFGEPRVAEGAAQEFPSILASDPPTPTSPSFSNLTLSRHPFIFQLEAEKAAGFFIGVNCKIE